MAGDEASIIVPVRRYPAPIGPRVSVGVWARIDGRRDHDDRGPVVVGMPNAPAVVPGLRLMRWQQGRAGEPECESEQCGAHAVSFHLNNTMALLRSKAVSAVWRSSHKV